MRELYKKLKSKEYRDGFVAAYIQDTVPFQIRALREQRGWYQRDLARALDVSQPAVAQYESPERALNLTTLQRVASAFDVALIVRFVPFSELARWAMGLSASSLGVEGFDHDRGFMERQSANVLNFAYGKLSRQRTGSFGSTHQLVVDAKKLVTVPELEKAQHV